MRLLVRAQEVCFSLFSPVLPGFPIIKNNSRARKSTTEQVLVRAQGVLIPDVSRYNQTYQTIGTSIQKRVKPKLQVERFP